MYIERKTTARDLVIVLLSLLIQAPLAFFLGHYYDERVFMATGYLAGSGLNPYQPYQFTNIFSNPLFAGTIPIIGYPPPWALVLGLAFRISFNVVPNLFFYNLATKIPVILGNVVLAFFVRNMLTELQVTSKKANFAWLFILFNPFLLLTTSAWGEFDTVAALFCIVSLYFLSKKRIDLCAVSLAVSISLKLIALALIPLPFFVSSNGQQWKKFRYLVIFSTVLLALWIGPFLIFGWNIPSVLSGGNSFFTKAGGISPFNVVEIIQDTQTIPPSLEFLGYLWLPALFVGYYFVSRSRPRSTNELIQVAIGLTLIFFLTRSWLSETNINLIFPLMLIAVAFNKITPRSLHFAWTIPLVFMVLNTSFQQLFFLVYPSVLTSLTQFDQQFRSVRLVARFGVTVLWQILGWSLVVNVLRRKSGFDALNEA